MADGLTDRQREVLELFVTAVRDGMPAPSYREICEALDFTSLNAAVDHIKALTKKGWLERGAKGRSRSIILTDHSRRIYGLPRRAA